MRRTVCVAWFDAACPTGFRLAPNRLGVADRFWSLRQTRDGSAFGDAVEAWKSGYFEGKYVFDEPEPGKLPSRDIGRGPARATRPSRHRSPKNPNKAGIRIDLSGIGVTKPK